MVNNDLDEEASLMCTPNCPFVRSPMDARDVVSSDTCLITMDRIRSFHHPCGVCDTEEELSAYSEDLLKVPDSIAKGEGGYVSSCVKFA
jgi:hypothetical protein